MIGGNDIREIITQQLPESSGLASFVRSNQKDLKLLASVIDKRSNTPDDLIAEFIIEPTLPYGTPSDWFAEAKRLQLQ